MRVRFVWLLPWIVACAAPDRVVPPLDGSLAVESGASLDVSSHGPRAIALDGPVLALCCDDGVLVFDVSSDEAILHISSVEDLRADAISMGGDRIVVAARRGVVGAGKRAEVDLLDPRQPLAGPAEDLPDADAVDVAIEGSYAVCTAGEGGAYLLEPSRQVALAIPRPRALAADIRRGRVFVLAADDPLFGDPRIYVHAVDARTGAPLSSSALDATLHRDASTPRGTLAAIAAGDGAVLASTGERLLWLDPSRIGRPDAVVGAIDLRATDLAADGDLVAVAADDVYLIDLAGPPATVAARVSMPGSTVGVAVSGRRVAAVDDRGNLRVFRVRAAEPPPP